MNRWNEGITESDILQNQFTAYVQTALQRCKSQYLEKMNRNKKYETELPNDQDAVELDFSNNVVDNVALSMAMKQINERERLIVTLHAAEGISFKEIAFSLEMKFSTVSMVYYRAIDKLRLILQDEDDGWR